MVMLRRLVSSFVAVVLLALASSSALADETSDAAQRVQLPVTTVYGRPQRPGVVIEIQRAQPEFRLRPIAPPSTFVPRAK